MIGLIGQGPAMLAQNKSTARIGLAGQRPAMLAQIE